MESKKNFFSTKFIKIFEKHSESRIEKLKAKDPVRVYSLLFFYFIIFKLQIIFEHREETYEDSSQCRIIINRKIMVRNCFSEHFSHSWIFSFLSSLLIRVESFRSSCWKRGALYFSLMHIHHLDVLLIYNINEWDMTKTKKKEISVTGMFIKLFPKADKKLKQSFCIMGAFQRKREILFLISIFNSKTLIINALSFFKTWSLEAKHKITVTCDT